MRIVFRLHEPAAAANRPSHHLADVALLLDEDPFPGLLIGGAAVWARANGRPGLSVTLPARRATKDGKDVFYSHFRQLDGSKALRQFKDEVIRRFVEEHPGVALPAAAGERGTDAEQQEGAGEPAPETKQPEAMG